MATPGLGGLPKPSPGELTIADVVARTGLTKEWVRRLATQTTGGIASRVVQHGKRQHYFFSEAAVRAYEEVSDRPARSRPRDRTSPASDEIRYLRHQIDKLQDDRDRLQGELMRLKVDWSAGEARLDELRRTCDRQAEMIARLTETLREAGQPPLALGN